MNRYDSYKPTGIEWIGEIPGHWMCKQIKRLSNVKRGASPRPIDDLKYFDNEGEFSWVRIADVTASERYLENTTQKLSELGASLSVKRYPSDFFLSIAGTVGKPVITKIKCCIHDGFVWFPNLKINPEFFYYIFSTGLPYQGLGKWGTQLNLNTDTVGEIFIPLPDNDEINVIVKYLDCKIVEIDKLIANKQQLIELLKEERTIIINEAVGGEEKNWVKKKLKYLVTKVGSGVTPNGGASVYQTEGIPLLRSQNIYNDGLRMDDVAYISSEIDKEMSNSRVMDNDVLLNITGASIGRSFYIPKGFGNGNVNQHVCIIRPDRNLIETKFLHLFLISGYGQNLIDYSQNGANREGLNFQQIKNFELSIPSINEQNSIVEFVEKETKKVDLTISKIEKEIELIQEYRTALISEVVTGKIKVLDVPVTISIPSCQAALAAEIMQQLSEEKTFGRVKFQKILYLCEYSGQLAGIESNYQRAAAGPLDDALLDTIEKELRALQWFDTASAPSKKFAERIVYSSLPKAAQYEKWYEKYWANSDENIQRIIGTLRFANTDTCEMIATLFAAWNDLIIKGIGQPSDDSIITEVYNWHIKKQRFTKPVWQKELSFMRKHHLIPTGFGKPTTTA